MRKAPEVAGAAAASPSSSLPRATDRRLRNTHTSVRDPPRLRPTPLAALENCTRLIVIREPTRTYSASAGNRAPV